eukprot:135518_1
MSQADEVSEYVTFGYIRECQSLFGSSLQIPEIIYFRCLNFYHDNHIEYFAKYDYEVMSSNIRHTLVTLNENSQMFVNTFGKIIFTDEDEAKYIYSWTLKVLNSEQTKRTHGMTIGFADSTTFIDVAQFNVLSHDEQCVAAYQNCVKYNKSFHGFRMEISSNDEIKIQFDAKKKILSCTKNNIPVEVATRIFGTEKEEMFKKMVDFNNIPLCLVFGIAHKNDSIELIQFDRKLSCRK